MAYFVPQWDVPTSVKVLSTDRLNGLSEGVYASFNLGTHVGDDLTMVLQNRNLLPTPSEPAWLTQPHGNQVLPLPLDSTNNSVADGSYTTKPGHVSVIMTADCLPVLLCNDEGNFVAAIHCGWRGLAADILKVSVSKFDGAPGKLMAWLGPAIGKQAFEVGEDVVSAFPTLPEVFAFKSQGKYFADIKAIAMRQLNALGVTQITVHPDCTYQCIDKYFSYRREGETGRMASMIWFE